VPTRRSTRRSNRRPNPPSRERPRAASLSTAPCNMQQYNMQHSACDATSSRIPKCSGDCCDECSACSPSSKRRRQPLLLQRTAMVCYGRPGLHSHDALHWPRRRSGLSVHSLCVDHCASESIDRRAPLITEWNGPTRCGTVHTVVCCRIRSLPRLGLQSLHNVCETHVSLTHGRHCALHSSARLTKESLSGRARSVGRTVERACPVGKPSKAALPFADCTLHSCCLNAILSSARVRATLGYTRHAARGVNHCERMCSVVL
jgi:hypothetical protein